MNNQKPNAVVETSTKNISRKFMKINDDGVCDACKYHKIKENKINWDEREIELKKILDKYRKNDGFDCIVPSSGGKDSAYVCHVLKYKYGMNPLSVTWAPNLYTDVGWKILQIIFMLEALIIFYLHQMVFYRYLTKIAFKFTTSIPTIYYWSKTDRSKNSIKIQYSSNCLRRKYC